MTSVHNNRSGCRQWSSLTVRAEAAGRQWGFCQVPRERGWQPGSGGPGGGEQQLGAESAAETEEQSC